MNLSRKSLAISEEIGYNYTDNRVSMSKSPLDGADGVFVRLGDALWRLFWIN